MLEWIILGAVLGGLTVAFWDEIKGWVRTLSYKIKKYSRMYIQKLSGNRHQIIIEGETKVVDASEVPEEIRKKAKYSPVDITAEAKRAGLLEL